MLQQNNMPDIFAARRENVRRLLRERRLDALLVSQPANRYYLSGFELHDPQINESAGRLVITADGRDWLATDRRYADAAARLWEPECIFCYSSRTAKDIAALLRRCGLRIGVEAECVSLAFARELAKEGAGLFIEAADAFVEDLRVCKDAAEIVALEQSFALNHKMFAWVEAECVQGRAESDLAWGVERYFRENGASELAFAVIAAVGKNAALPHAVPGTDTITTNCPVLVDAGCRVGHYCSDQTRTYWVGKRSGSNFARFERAFSLVCEAQKAALNMLRPGVTGREAYAAAMSVFEKAGEAKAFTHGLGHGVGLETHEAPVLCAKSEQKLAPGMVVTVEPGLYYPQWGGVRWEHAVLVVEDGIRIL